MYLAKGACAAGQEGVVGKRHRQEGVGEGHLHGVVASVSQPLCDSLVMSKARLRVFQLEAYLAYPINDRPGGCPCTQTSNEAGRFAADSEP